MANIRTPLLCRTAKNVFNHLNQRFVGLTSTKLSNTIINPPEHLELEYLNYDRRRKDPIETKKARLLYQSRKRGMLENGLLLSTFAAKYLSDMNESQVDEYDKIINLPSNDWDIFNWAMGIKPTPVEFENGVMEMLKNHIKNVDRETRLYQPPLYPE
ncbi:uncharacterized protein CBL_04497 [Carabus blaptoides fortunei]